MFDNRRGAVLVSAEIEKGVAIEPALRNIDFRSKPGFELSAQILYFIGEVDSNQQHNYKRSEFTNFKNSIEIIELQISNPNLKILIAQAVFLDFVVDRGPVDFQQLRGQRHIPLGLFQGELDVALLDFRQGQNLIGV